MKKLTIEDVAQKAGVSKSTVSQFLNKRFKYMSEATKNRIAAVIEELNYQPNGLARSLKQNRTFMVGVIVANIDYSLSIQCIRAIENELQRHGIQVIICNADENADKENTYVETLVARQVDGLIIFPTGDNPSVYTRLIEAHYPLVFMDRLVEGVTTQSLLLDNEMAVKTAVKELVRHGHEAIALLSLPLGEHAITPRRERMSGFRKAMEDAGLALNEQYMRSVPREEIASALDALLALPQPPTALLAANDLVLGEILKYANRHSIAIPGRLSVIGIDDAEFARIYNPDITTIRQPAYEMGMQAAKIMLSLIENEDTSVPITYRFPPALQQGQSVQAPAK
ncbi:LacI family transcriptional regulator [Paenibacillus sp. FSL H7-0357]|uniref:LacI family DNA-binding transcriptional regulator n=1 Tax=Paenibacillus sp. FSL H7-0357 TaxID=1536774 RepID=UPI0004F82B42|nr:LacI family DNA-binding transcriptional regulator [Paenibacillus sp. FSL H7-0357]AIQ19981.1 LacI family transcriptional regulator [Paenibacillus sp. FSL H7-0357]